MSDKRALLDEVNAATTGEWKVWDGGDGFFSAQAQVWAGAVKLQSKGPRGAAVDVAGMSLSADGSILFSAPPGELRAVNTGTPTKLTVIAIRTRQR